MQQGSPDALFAAIAQSGNEVTQGWMRVMAGAPAGPASFPWANSSLQREYFDKQAKLWTALASGKRETLASPEPGDRRFAAKEWRDNAYYDYLKQSYLLAARYLEALVESAELEPKAKERAASR
jgi:polyhydroxyalkanoate synthase